MRHVVLLFATTLLTTAFAHNTRTVGEGAEQYQVTLGYVHEPPYTEQLNDLDLIVRTPGNEPVENLESSLRAAIVAPDGASRRELPLRAQYGQPGHYTRDFILSEPGVYTFEITGFIGGLEVDLSVPYDHEVSASEGLRFP